MLMFMRNVLRGTANIAYKMNLKTPDALHAATAVLNDCALFVTNDSAFSRVGDLTVAILSEVIILNEDSYANEKRE